MVNYLIRRVFQMTIVVFLSSLAIYVILNVAPGGPLSGLRLSADRRNRVSDQDIARLTAYLGLDKPLALRYLVWLIGDDWLGADYMYVGLTPYTEQFGTSEDEVTIYRFWSEAGVALLEPTYLVWVFGEVAEESIQIDVYGTDTYTGVEYTATRIEVNPLHGAVAPDDVLAIGEVMEVQGALIVVEELNYDKFRVITTAETEFVFQEGAGRPHPDEGTWVNVSGIFGAYGLLGELAGYHANNRGILRMDYGISWSNRQPVLTLIQSRLGNTITLMALSSIISLVVAIPIGIYSAVHQYSRVDYAVTTFSFFGSAMPVFWFGLMMILVFSKLFKDWGLPFLPSGGTSMVRAAPAGSLLDLLGAEPDSFIDRAVHLFMPATVLSLLYMAGWSRFMRAAMLEVLRMDYVRTARAKGLKEQVVIVKHAARNALIPIVTIIVYEIPAIFSGAILTETIFSYPGMGRLYFSSLGKNDWPVVMVVLFISAILTVIATLVRDVLYTIVDPRIKFT